MRLTQRDFEILEYLAAQGVATAKQLTRKFFPSYQAFKTRMKLLRGVGLVESSPLSTLKELSESSYRTSLFLVDAPRASLRKFRVYRLGERFNRKWPEVRKLSDLKMWKHQL